MHFSLKTFNFHFIPYERKEFQCKPTMIDSHLMNLTFQELSPEKCSKRKLKVRSFLHKIFFQKKSFAEQIFAIAIAISYIFLENRGIFSKENASLFCRATFCDQGNKSQKQKFSKNFFPKSFCRIFFFP